MPPIDVNWHWFYGLGVLAIIWCAAWLITKVLYSKLLASVDKIQDQGLATQKRRELLLMGQEMRDSLRVLGIVFIVGWVTFFLTAGGISFKSSQDSPAGELQEEIDTDTFYGGENQPEHRTSELREEGDKLQEDSLKELDSFRHKFMKDKETNAKPD